MKNLPFDKKLHLVFGAFIGLTTMLIAKDYGFSKNFSVYSGAIASVVSAIGKELYDKISGKGTVEKMDIFYTIFGGSSLVLIYEFIKTMI